MAKITESPFDIEDHTAHEVAEFWVEHHKKFTDNNGKEQTRTITYLSEEEAPKNAIKKTRLSVRYSELLAFIISAI